MTDRPCLRWPVLGLVQQCYPQVTQWNLGGAGGSLVGGHLPREDVSGDNWAGLRFQVDIIAQTKELCNMKD